MAKLERYKYKTSEAVNLAYDDARKTHAVDVSNTPTVGVTGTPPVGIANGGNTASVNAQGIMKVCLYDEDGNKAIEGETNAVKVIDYAHHEIHEGVSYTAETVATGGDGTKATLTFTTPNTATWVHCLVHARSNVEAHYTLGESPTITASTGSNFTVYNRNRNSDNNTGIIGTEQTVSGQMTENATVTNLGTILEEISFGNGKVGGESRGGQEWILKQGTTYVLETEAEAASADVMAEIDWYEKKND